MKQVKLALVTLVILSTIFLVFGCKGNTPTSTTKTQTSTVQKGTISLTVVGTGNLALAQTQDLAFEMAGTVESVLIETGSSVKNDQELVRLDTSDWEDQIASLEKALTTAQRNLTTTQSSLTKAQRQVSSKQLAVKQAELDLQSVQDNVNNITEVKKYQDKVDKAQYDLDFSKSMLEAAAKDPSQTMSVPFWNQEILNDKQTLAEAQAALKSALSGTNTSLSNDVALQIAKAQLQVEQSQRSLEDAKIAIEDANTAVDNAKLNVQDSQQAVKDAQDNLNEVKAFSPVIIAPFDGFITKVNVKGGDKILKGTVAVQVADPNKFEANILVTEQDIFSVKLGGDATVSLDALSDLSFPAKITQIAPTATVQQGVVNYKVTVELASLVPTSGTNSSGQRFSPSGSSSTGLPADNPNITPGSPNLPANITPPAGFTPPAGTTGGTTGTNQRNPGAGNVSAITLKDGLSSTVTIIVQQKQGILLLPSRAVTRKGQTSTVQVIKGTTTETRNVKTGITDGTNIEITDGLAEGDQVVFTTTTSSSTNSNNQNRNIGIGGPGIRLP